MVARVLVVDSDEAAIDGLEPALRRADLEPITALDHVTAVKLFEELQPDVVLIGVHAYGLDARALASALRQRSANVPLLFMGHGALSDPIRAPSEALDAGGDYYFRLPTDLGYLAGRVKGWTRTSAVKTATPDPRHEELYALSAELDGDLDLEGLHDSDAPGPENPALTALRSTNGSRSDPTPNPAIGQGPVTGRARTFGPRSLPQTSVSDRPPPPGGRPSVDTARALVREAEALRGSGQLEEAIETYQTAASMYAQDGEVKPALALYKLLLYLNPARLEMALQGAIFAARHGKTADARALLERSAQALEDADRLPDALDLVLRFIEQAGPDPQLMTLRRRLEAALPTSGDAWGAKLDEAVAEQRELLERAGGLPTPGEAKVESAAGWGGTLDLLGLEARPSDDLYPDDAELNRPRTRDIAAPSRVPTPTALVVGPDKTLFTPDQVHPDQPPSLFANHDKTDFTPDDDHETPFIPDDDKTDFTPRAFPAADHAPLALPVLEPPPMVVAEDLTPPIDVVFETPVEVEDSPPLEGLEASHARLAALRDAPKPTAELVAPAGHVTPPVLKTPTTGRARPASGRHRRPRLRPGAARTPHEAADIDHAVHSWPHESDAAWPVVAAGQATDAAAFEFPIVETVPKTRPADRPAAALEPLAMRRLDDALFDGPDPLRPGDSLTAQRDFAPAPEDDRAFESKTEELDLSSIPELAALQYEDLSLTEEIPLGDEDAAALGRAIGPDPRPGEVDPARRDDAPAPALVPPTIPLRPLDPTRLQADDFGPAMQGILRTPPGAHARPTPLPPRAPSFTRGAVTDLRESLEVLGELLAIGATGVLRNARVQLVIADGQPSALRGTDACRSLIAEAQKGRSVPLESLPEGLDNAGSPAVLAHHLVAQGVMSGSESTALLHSQLEVALRKWLGSTGPWQFTATEVFQEELLSALPDVRRTLIDLLAGTAARTISIDPALVVRSGTLQAGLLDRRDARYAALLDGRHTVGEAARIAGLNVARAAAVTTVLLGFRLAVAVGRASSTAPARAPSGRRPSAAPSHRSTPSGVYPQAYPAETSEVPASTHAALRTLATADRLRALAEMVRTSDYFTMLGVTEDASWHDVDEAHRQLRNMVPTPKDAPDSGPPLVREVIRSIDEARDVLKIPELRAAYLRHLRR